MSIQPVTINLSDSVLQRLQRAAHTLQRPLDEMIEQTIVGNLPPLIEDLPSEIQAEAAILQQADDQSLWRIVQEALPEGQWERHTELLAQQQERDLSQAETQELVQLRTAADRFVLRRSFVLALLKWRGHTLPAGIHPPLF